jgi:hypothetical protein
MIAFPKEELPKEEAATGKELKGSKFRMSLIAIIRRCSNWERIESRRQRSYPHVQGLQQLGKN